MPFFRSVTAPVTLGLAALILTGCAAGGAPQADGEAGAQTSASASASAQASEAAAEVTVATAQGEVTVPFQPTRVAVIDHGVLDTINALGAGESVAAIPHDRVPAYLTEYTTTTANAGGLDQINYTALNALGPDLIIVAGESAETLSEMEAIAPTIDLSLDGSGDEFMSSFEANTLALGQIFGVEDEAAAAVTEVQAKATALTSQTAGAGEGLVVVVGANSIEAFGRDAQSRYDFVYNLLGVTPAIDQSAIDAEGDAVSFAFLADLDPDLLIVLDQDVIEGEPDKGARAVVDNFVANSMTAVLNDKVAYVDTEKWHHAYGGLSAVASTFDEVSALVN